MNPELLDHLAAKFIADGWSVKALIRYIVTSRAWQLAAEPPPRADELDANNDLLSHARVQRLEAEAIRDAMLAVAGNLAPGHTGPGVRVFYRTLIDPVQTARSRSDRWRGKAQPLPRSAPPFPERIPRRVRCAEAEHLHRAPQRNECARAKPRAAQRSLRAASGRALGEAHRRAQWHRRAAHRAHVSRSLRPPAQLPRSFRAATAFLAPVRRRPVARSRARALQHEGIHLPAMNPLSRRQLLRRSAHGFGWLALSALLARESRGAAHFAPRAKNVILLFMDGGVSQVDSFDPKPRLKAEHGKPFGLKIEATQFDNIGKVLASPWEFQNYGQSGTSRERALSPHRRARGRPVRHPLDEVRLSRARAGHAHAALRPPAARPALHRLVAQLRPRLREREPARLRRRQWRHDARSAAWKISPTASSPPHIRARCSTRSAAASRSQISRRPTSPPGSARSSTSSRARTAPSSALQDGAPWKRRSRTTRPPSPCSPPCPN